MGGGEWRRIELFAFDEEQIAPSLGMTEMFDICLLPIESAIIHYTVSIAVSVLCAFFFLLLETIKEK